MLKCILNVQVEERRCYISQFFWKICGKALRVRRPGSQSCFYCYKLCTLDKHLNSGALMPEYKRLSSRLTFIEHQLCASLWAEDFYIILFPS